MILIFASKIAVVAAIILVILRCIRGRGITIERSSFLEFKTQNIVQSSFDVVYCSFQSNDIGKLVDRNCRPGGS